MQDKDLPDYVKRGGDPTLKQPFEQLNSTMYGFVMDGDIDQLQALCDQWLNEPSGGAVNYRALTSKVVLTFTDMKHVASMDPEDKDKGWCHEVDVAYWVLTAAVRETEHAYVVERLAWFTPYIYVDNPFTLISGREIYGFPKNMGRFNLPSGPDKVNELSVDVNGLKTYSPDTEAQWQRLFTVRRADQDRNIVQEEWKHSRDALSSFMHRLMDGQEKITVPGFELLINLYEYISHREIPMVFLKQFRDAHNPNKACYQAIVEAKAQLMNFDKAGLLKNDFNLTIKDVASQPLVQDLGLESSMPEIDWAYWMSFDFSVLDGDIIWEA